MDCCHDSNMSMISTHRRNVSKLSVFMDTFFGDVHNVDMRERIRAIVKLDAAIASNLKELGYGG